MSSKTDARLDLADELANLVEALKDPVHGEGMLEELDSKGEIRLVVVLGKNRTLFAIKQWEEDEIKRLKDEHDEEWAEFLYEKEDDDGELHLS